MHNQSLEALQNFVQQKDRVYIGTLHSSKGKEAKAVIIAGAESLNTKDKIKQMEYRRLFYVGITRAKDRLYVTFERPSYLAAQLANGVSGKTEEVLQR